MTLANDFSKLLEIRVKDLPEAVNRLERKTIAEVSLLDLSGDPDHANGLYVIFGVTGECFYIGKATSKSFIDRVPEHFDPRESAWMNTFPKKIAVKDSKRFATALADSLSCSISLLFMDEKTLRMAGPLEAAMRYLLKPRYNALDKKPIWLDETKTLRESSLGVI